MRRCWREREAQLRRPCLCRKAVPPESQSRKGKSSAWNQQLRISQQASFKIKSFESAGVQSKGSESASVLNRNTNDTRIRWQGLDSRAAQIQPQRVLASCRRSDARIRLLPFLLAHSCPAKALLARAEPEENEPKRSQRKMSQIQHLRHSTLLHKGWSLEFS